MSDRLSALDASFLYLEETTTPMHVGGLAIFAAPAEGFDQDRLADLIESRLGLVPRYRQRVRDIPGRLANRSGSTTRTSTSRSTSAAPDCPSRAPTSSCSNSSAG